MLRHLKYSVPDFILCLLASVGLAVNLVQSFLLPEGLSADIPRMFLLCAVTVLALIFLSYNRVSAIAGAILGVLALAAVAGLTAMGYISGFAESSDAEANVSLWYLLVILCAVFTYLMFRTRATSWVFLAFGVILSAYFLLLEYIYYWWGLVLLLWSVGVWLCYITYRRKILQVNAQRTAFLPVLGHAAGLATLCLAIGCLLWWGIIRPLQPPTRAVYLTEYLVQVDWTNVVSVYDPVKQWTPDTYSDNVDSADESSEQEENPDSETEQDVEGSQDEEHSEEENDEQSGEELDVTQEEGSADYITYNRWLDWRIVLTLAILLALFIIALIFFLRRRKIWYKRKTAGLDDGSYIRFFYAWYLRKLTRVLKLPAPRGNTPLEYAALVEGGTRFLDDTGVTWAEMSEIYARTVYSGRPPQPEDKSKFEQFYRGFHRACRKKLHFSWLWKSLRL